VTVDFVAATIRGKPVKFRLGPKRLEAFEAMHGSAIAALSAFRGGRWTVADLRNVLAAAWPGKAAWTGTAHAEIEAAFAANRPATYAPLATLILAAALAGIREEDATFDEAEG
jgi:hypothetical protein